MKNNNNRFMNQQIKHIIDMIEMQEQVFRNEFAYMQFHEICMFYSIKFKFKIDFDICNKL